MTEEQIKKARHNYASRVYHEQMRSASEGEVYGFEVGYRAAYSEIESQLSSKDKECDELKRINSEYKQLLDPILDWGQDEGHEHRLKLGESITKTVLNRAKEYNTLRAENERLTIMATDAELLRTKLDYKTEENKRNILAINDLRKRCEDMEAETADLTKAISDYDNIISENYQSYKENKHILMEALKHARKGFLSAQMIAQTDFYEKIFQSHIQEIDKLLSQ